MSAPRDLLDLRRLDEARPFDLSPQIWADNLAALRAAQPDLASELAQLSLPASWRPVRALDDAPTWRLEGSGQPPQWLAQSSAPATRASALLRDLSVADRNPALASIGAGAELALLLERLSRWQAVYVFEDEPLSLAAVLRLLPLASALADGRCVLVPPRREERFLIELLEREPGMLPPGNLICLPSTPRPRVEQLRALCEQLAQRVGELRAARLDSLRSRAATALPAAGPMPRLAAAALTPDPLSQWLAIRLAAAARALGWDAAECVMDHPQRVGPVPHAERLCDLAPGLVVCVNHPRAWLPLHGRATICEWHLNEYDVLGSLAADDTLHLAATPGVARALAAAGAAPARIVDFFYAAPDEALVEPPDTASSCVLIVGDLPDPRPAACGIEHSSHVHLWNAIERAAAAAWERSEPLGPEALLRSAERASGVEITVHSLRRQWLMLTERVRIASLVLERTADIAASAGLELRVVGTGWQRLGNPDIRVLAEREADLLLTSPSTGDVRGLPALTGPRPLAAIFAGRRDPLRLALVFAAAAGYPLMLHAPRGAAPAAQLGSVLHPGEHLTTFAGPRELREALAVLRADPSAAIQRARRAREHVQAHHTLGCRLRKLAERLGGGAAGVSQS